MMKIYLLGVTHNFQKIPHLDFEKYVVESLSRLGIKSVGEEMSLDGLKLKPKISVSTTKTIADNLKIPHRYCDPDDQEREKRGIIGHDWIEGQCKSNDEIEKGLREDDEKRELVWLEKLKDIFENPMLFICGSAHLNTFSTLLRNNGYTCEILEKKWKNEPTNILTN